MKKNILEKSYNNESKLFEIGIDEAGRGPMFGRVYTSAVILPKNYILFAIILFIVILFGSLCILLKSFYP